MQTQIHARVTPDLSRFYDRTNPKYCAPDALPDRACELVRCRDGSLCWFTRAEIPSDGYLVDDAGKLDADLRKPFTF